MPPNSRRPGSRPHRTESVKTILAKEPKWITSLFLRFRHQTWDKPKCRVIPKFPFITVEKEIDDLIAVSGRKNAALCQVFDDTTMRSGEAKRILWTDLDVERRTITLNQP